MNEVRKVIDGLGRVWYEGWFQGEQINDCKTIDFTYWDEPCRHRLRWIAHRHIDQRVKRALAQLFHEVQDKIVPCP